MGGKWAIVKGVVGRHQKPYDILAIVSDHEEGVCRGMIDVEIFGRERKGDLGGTEVF